MVVGETSDSFSMLLQSVSRGSVGSRCASGSETAAETEFANDCPSQTRMLLEHGHETRARNTANQPPAAAAGAACPTPHADWAAQYSPVQSAAGTALASPWRCDVTAACRGAAGVYL